MDFSALCAELEGQLVEGGLTLKNTEANGNAYTDLLRQLRGSFVLHDCRLLVVDQMVCANGSCSLPPLCGGEGAPVEMLFWVEEGDVHFSLSVRYPGTYALPALLGGNQAILRPLEDMQALDETALGLISAVSPTLSADWETLRQDRPFCLKGGVRFAAGVWDLYTAWLQTALTLEGELSLLGSPFYEGADWRVCIGLQNISLPAGVLDGLLQNGGFAIELEGAAWNTGELQVAQPSLVCHLQPPTLGTALEARAELFSEGHGWAFTVDMDKGLSAENLLAFVAEMLGVGGSSFLPDALVFNNIGLYHLGLAFTGDPASLEFVDITLGTISPIQLPLPGVTLNNAMVAFEAGFPDEPGGYSYWRGDLSAGLTVELYGGLVLWMDATLTIPALVLEASATLRQGGQQPGLANVIGDGPAAALQNGLSAGANGLLADAYLYADVNERQLEVSVGFYDVLQWRIGKLAFTVEEARVKVMLSQQGAAFGLIGRFALQSGQAAPFVLTVEGGFDSGEWAIACFLSSGTIDLGGVLLALLDIDYRSEKALFELTEFDISFTTKQRAFSFAAAFYNNWGSILGGIPVQSEGRFQLRVSDELENPFLAVMLGLTIGPFALSAQVNDFFDDTKASYIFQIALDGHALRATYAKKQVGEALHDQLTVELVNTTLGDIVKLLIGVVNPNFRHSLPAPWNLLDRIDLSRLKLVYDLSEETISVTYSLNLTIPAIFTVTGVGLRYKKGGTGSGLDFILEGKPLAETEAKTYVWDAIDGAPPKDIAAGDTRFTLHYLGMGSHYSTAKIKGADTISGAIAALQEDFSQDVLRFDEETNWLLGLHFTLKDMLDFKLVFNDPVLYGMEITVSAQKPPLQVFKGLALMLLYKKITKDIGMFKVTLTMPDKFRRVQLGALSFTIGQLGLELYTNRDFYLDLGFPTGQDFSRSFSLEAGYYVGRGGLYFGLLSNDTAVSLPATTKGTFGTVVTIGVGLSLGVGRSFDFSVVKGGVSLEVFGIFEGTFGIFHPSDGGDDALYYNAKAVVGIVGRLWLTADLKIITVNASVEIKAYASVALAAYEPIEMELALSLKLQASVKILFIRIRFSYSFSAKLEVTIGSASTPPWANDMKLHVQAPTVERLYPLRALRAEKTRLPLSLTPIFSQDDEGRPVVAVAPLLYPAAFRQLAALLVDWTLEPYGDIITPEAQRYGFSQIQSRVDYAALDAFLSANLIFSMEAAQLAAASGEEQQAVAMAMPPPARLQVTSGEEVLLSMQYWLANLVGDEYIGRLRACFERLYPVPEKPQDNMFSDDMAPLAELVFTDYFHMLLRQLKACLEAFFSSVALPAETLPELPDICGVSAAQALQAAPEFLVLPHIAVHDAQTTALLPGETLAALAKRAGVDLAAIWTALAQERGALDTGTSLHLTETRFENRAGLTLEKTAALYFVRLWEDRVPDGYQECLQPIFDLNPDMGLTEEWRHTMPLALILPGGHAWTSHTGDTMYTLARTALLLQARPAAWRAYCEELSALNGAALDAVLAQVRIPAAESSLAGELCLATLVERLHPDGSTPAVDGALANTAFLRAGWLVRVPIRVATTQTLSVREICASFGVCTESLATWLCDTPENIAPGQKITLGKVPLLRKEWAARLLKQEDRADELGMLASRFMLQGNRLPALEGGEDTTAFYQLLGQQVPLVQGEDVSLELAAGQPACSWLQGELTQRYPWQDIEDSLPFDGFDWTSYLRTAMQAADIAQAPRSYTPGSRMLLEGSGYAGMAVYMAPKTLVADLPVIQRLCMLAGDGSAGEACAAAAYLPLVLQPGARDNEYEVVGVAPAYRAALKALADLALGQELDWKLCHIPSPLQTEGVLYAAGWDAEKSLLYRHNLSTVTHFAPVTRRNTANNHAVRLGSPEVLRMLWECSTVGGGGYRLLLQDENGGGLPAALFGEEGGTIYLLAVDDGTGALRKSGAANAVLAPALDTITFTAACGSVTDLAPVFPVGNAGFTAELTAPGEEESREAATRRLFNILCYRVAGQGYRPVKHSTPLPPEKEERGAWCYTAALPLYGMLQPSAADPYAALGKDPGLAIGCLDILGNQAPGWKEIAVKPVYNDRLLAVHEWPCCQPGYQIEKTQEGPCLILELRPQDRKGLDQPAAATEYLRAALRQLAMPDIELRLACSFGGLWVLGPGQNAALLAFGEAMAAYLAGQAACPVPFAISFPFGEVSATGILPLAVELTVCRTRHLPAQAGLCVAHTLVPPSLEACAEDGQAPDVAFAEAFEEAFPAAKLARPDGRDTGLCVVTIGPGAALPRPTIRPAAREDGLTAPTFACIRPLANTRLGRDVQLARLGHNGDWMEETESIRLAGVDMDTWKAVLFSDLEGLLAGEDALRFEPKVYTRLACAKRALATATVRALVPLEQGSEADVSAGRDALEDSLCRSLLADGGFASVAQYELVWEGKAPSQVRMEVALLPEAAGEQDTGLAATAAKLDSESDTFCVLYAADSPVVTGFVPAYTLQITELEYDISTNENGYESSRWVQFIRPLRPGDGILTADLTSELRVPNPLRSCPANPALLDQRARFGYKLTEWTYGLLCAAELAEQDSYHIDVSFSRREAPRKRGEQDLFDVFAVYMANRDVFLALLAGTDVFIRQRAAESLAGLLEQAAALWDSWLQAPPVARAKAGPATASARLRARFRPEPHLEVETDWPHGASAWFEETPAPAQTACLWFELSGIDIYSKHIAAATVQTIRNAGLLETKVGGTLAVDNTFVYRSQQMGMEELYAGHEETDERLVAVMQGGCTEATVQQAVAQLFETLGTAGQDVAVAMAIGYAYPLAGGLVELPLAMFTPTPCDTLPPLAAQAISGWYAEAAPPHRRFSLLFRVDVQHAASGETLLGYTRLRIDFADENELEECDNA